MRVKKKNRKNLWIKTSDLIKLITKNSDDYDKFEIWKFNKIIVIPTMTIVVRAVFYENNKYYLQVFFR